LKGEFRESPLAFKVYYFTFIALGFSSFAYLVRAFPLQRFPKCCSSRS
jgi:hypothetical protein